MSIEREQLQKQLEEKYNINLDIQTELGEKTYWELREYFTKEIEEDNLLIRTDFTTMCCHRTDIKCIKEEFNKQLRELTKYESNEICEHPDEDILSAITNPCQYADNKPPPYN